jgi:hypothetical protein
MNGTCKGDGLLRNLLLSKDLLAVLCSVFWFWFLSFCFLSLFVHSSFGYCHNILDSIPRGSEFLRILWVCAFSGRRRSRQQRGARGDFVNLEDLPA